MKHEDLTLRVKVSEYDELIVERDLLHSVIKTNQTVADYPYNGQKAQARAAARSKLAAEALKYVVAALGRLDQTPRIWPITPEISPPDDEAAEKVEPSRVIAYDVLSREFAGGIGVDPVPPFADPELVEAVAGDLTTLAGELVDLAARVAWLEDKVVGLLRAAA